MKMKRSLTFFFMVVLTLAACVPADQVQGNQPAANPSPIYSTSKATPTHAPGCTVRTAQSKPNPTVESLIPDGVT